MKWFLRIVGGLIVLFLLVAAIVLIPAHRQVRSVAPELPSQKELLALTTSLQKPSQVRYVLTSSQTLERGQISHISILVEWLDGKSFLIDTGMSRDEAENFAALLRKLDSSAGDAIIYGTVSELLGPNISAVQGVGFTHLHIDHTQGVENFCRAKGAIAAVLQTPSQSGLHNFNTTVAADLIANSCLTPIDFSRKQGGSLYQTSQFPGIAAFELGGHTPGSTLWVVALGSKVLLFSGDTTNNKASIDHDIPKSALYSYVLVPENIKRTAQLRKWLKDLDQQNAFSVIVSHDLENTAMHINEFVQK